LAACRPGRVCLIDGRFRVEVSFRDYRIRGDPCQSPAAIRPALVLRPRRSGAPVKVIDGCSLNGHWWVTAPRRKRRSTPAVTDTLRHEVREYPNTLGNRAAALTDSAAFATCP
jgi:hypothetical protein